MDFGVPEDRIITEDRATITRENFLHCKEILAELFSGRRRIVTVSSYSHLVRSVSLARAYIPEHEHVVCRATVSTDSPERFTESPEMRKRVMKEYVALWAYAREWKLIPDFFIS